MGESEMRFRYHPVLRDATEIVANCGPSRLLAIGNAEFELLAIAAETRRTDETYEQLPKGVYVFENETFVAVMIVRNGGTPFSETESFDETADGQSTPSWQWFRQVWESASVVPPPTFRSGDDVQVAPRQSIGIVRRRIYGERGWNYSVSVDGTTLELGEGSLATPSHDEDPFSWITRAPATSRRFTATLTRAKLMSQLSNTFYSFRASKTIFRAYQFRPIVRLLAKGIHRILIADEVGLGKTIEAGLIWTELDARGLADRVLIVCPSSLVEKWRLEMTERFGFEPRILERSNLDEMLWQLEEDRLPRRLQAICSLERLRMWPSLERLEEIAPRFDLVIVDEAHSFRNSETKSYELGEKLAEWAEALVFLTATPLNLHNRDLYNLLCLLDPDDFQDANVLEQRLQPNGILNRVLSSLLDRETSNEERIRLLNGLHTTAFGRVVMERPEFAELLNTFSGATLDADGVVEARRLLSQLHSLSSVVVRTRKVDVHDRKTVREPIRIDVEWSEQERSFYTQFVAWRVERARARGIPVGFATQMDLRLASSCLPAARERVLDAVRGDGWRAEEDLDGLEPISEDATFELPHADLVRSAEELATFDSKFESFLPRLQEIVASGRRVLLFTFSRRTLAYLEKRLSESSGIRLAALHGGVRGDDRHRIMREFREGKFDVLISSQVASEGLDFEFCSVLVNYDLPWNPMQVEQRIGRLDRIGQESEKILILNFHTPGTIETEIFSRLMDRIGIFKESVGDLEPILQSQIKNIQKAVFDFSLSVEQRARRLDEMAAVLVERDRSVAEVEQARTYLASTDDAEIEGLESELLNTGRYIGQRELALLLEDWATVNEGSVVTLQEGVRLKLRGSRAMEKDLLAVQTRGERSSREVERLAEQLRNEEDIAIGLDVELSRVKGWSLLTANHPLVRAALAVPSHQQARYSHVILADETSMKGTYLVLLSIARWKGVRESSELWATAVDLESGELAPSTVGGALLSSAAEGNLSDGEAPVVEVGSLTSVLTAAVNRRDIREEWLQRENASLVAVRRTSLEQSYIRQIADDQRRLKTAQERGSDRAVLMFEGRIRQRRARLEEELARLEDGSYGTLSLEHIAVCTVRIGNDERQFE